MRLSVALVACTSTLLLAPVPAALASTGAHRPAKAKAKHNRHTTQRAKSRSHAAHVKRKPAPHRTPKPAPRPTPPPVTPAPVITPLPVHHHSPDVDAACHHHPSDVDAARHLAHAPAAEHTAGRAL